jgi:hypothetical protein
MYTTHGYHIAGTKFLATVPESQVAPCGGPDVCGECEAEAFKQLGDRGPEELASLAYTTVIEEKIEELNQLIVGAYANSRERSLAITNIEQGGLWLEKCTPADQVVSSDERYREAVAISRGD